MYERKGDRILDQYPLDTGGTIYMIADAIRDERSGKHAKIAVWLDDLQLGWDVFNFERRGDRVNLANAAHKRLGDLERKACPQTRMQAILDAFCAGLWAAYLDASRAIMLSGGAEVLPLDFYLRPFIHKGGGTILVGPRGAGKTYIAEAMARCVEQGISTIWDVRQAPILFVQLERSEYSFGRRVTMGNKAMGLAPALPMLTLCARGKSLADVKDAIRYHVEQDGVEVVFIDSISRAGAGKLTEDYAANAIMDTLNNAAPTWVGLAHISHAGKDDQGGAHVFGSIMFENAADVVVQLTSSTKGDTLGCGLQIIKANDVGDNAMHYLALDFDRDLGLTGIRSAGEHEFPDLSGRPQSLSVQCRDYLLTIGKADAAEIAQSLGKDRANVSATLNKMADVGRERSGHKVLFYVKGEAA